MTSTLTCRNLGVQGRLGNALFEFAASYGIARREGQDLILPEDWIHRPYFSVPDHMFGSVPDDALDAYHYAFHIDERVRPYLQDVSLFDSYLDEIRWMLRPSELAQEALDGYHPFERPTLGIHVRRGDLATEPGIEQYHVITPADYYHEARSLLPVPAMTAVFSDDIAWCREYIPAAFYGEGTPHAKEHEPEFLTTAPRDWIDLFLLARCDYLIITGSTFGIWSALLADVDPSCVVRARGRYGPLLNFIDEDLMFDPRWQVAPCS